MGPVICTEFPDKKRYGRHNRDGAVKDARKFQQKYKKNLRVYDCVCGGFHLTSESLNQYLAYSKNANSEVATNYRT